MSNSNSMKPLLGRAFVVVRVAFLTLAAATTPARAAQNPESFVAQLRSSDWRVRSGAIARLNQVPVRDLPVSFAATAIPLLEREATNPDPDLGKGEGYGEYQLALISGVLRLDDPRSLRGMALLGMKTGRRAKEFVARQGAAAIPYLDEAWERDPLGRHEVVKTWGYMIGPFGNRLSRQDSLALIGRLLRGAREQPQGFTTAAEIARLAEAVPLVERISQTASHDLVRRGAGRVTSGLRARRDSLSPVELVRRLDLWISAVCEAQPAPRQAACQNLLRLSGNVVNQVQASGGRRAQPALDALAQESERSRAQGVLDELERALIVGNTEYVKTRP